MGMFKKRGMADAAQQALKEAKSGARKWMGRIGDAGSKAAREVVAAGAAVRDAQLRMVDAGRGYVRENPLKSSAITLALGAMAASLILMGRRR